MKCGDLCVSLELWSQAVSMQLKNRWVGVCVGVFVCVSSNAKGRAVRWRRGSSIIDLTWGVTHTHTHTLSWGKLTISFLPITPPADCNCLALIYFLLLTVCLCVCLSSTAEQIFPLKSTICSSTMPFWVSWLSQLAADLLLCRCWSCWSCLLLVSCSW